MPEPGPMMLNLGCGPDKRDGWINIDKSNYYRPDVFWDLDNYPWPFDTSSVDMIYASHIFEHLKSWWKAFLECDRILKPKGKLEIRVPDFTGSDTLTPRGHKSSFSTISFSGVNGVENLWRKNYPDFEFPDAETHMRLEKYARIPHTKYLRWWLPKCVLKWCMNHLNNFVIEQRFYFVKNN